jgi:hypothetical protein
MRVDQSYCFGTCSSLATTTNSAMDLIIARIPSRKVETIDENHTDLLIYHALNHKVRLEIVDVMTLIELEQHT